MQRKILRTIALGSFALVVGLGAAGASTGGTKSVTVFWSSGRGPDTVFASVSKSASDSEVKAVRREWNAWRTELEQVLSEEIAKAVRELGSAWRPESTADLDQVGGALG
jgi:hypothetical protein